MAAPLRKSQRSRTAFARLWDSRLYRAVIWAQAIGGAILLLWFIGGLQPLELLVYDMLQVTWAGHLANNRIVLIGVTEADIEKFDFPLRDSDLATLLERIASWKPRAIGVDIYRDKPKPPGTERLAAVLAQHKEIVWTFKPQEGATPGILPPEVLRGTDRAVLADLIPDPGNVIRRALLYAGVGDENYTAMGMGLALRYLAADHIGPAPGLGGDELRLGKAVLSPLDDTRGPYTRLDSRGYQTLLDYHGGLNPFPLKSMGEIMGSDDAASLIIGRLVIVGFNSESVHDSFSTPFNTGFNKEEQMSGIVVHAHIADQLIREALDGDPVLSGLPRAYAALFIWSWSVAGALVGSMLNTRVWVVGAVISGLCVLGSTVYGLFGLALWLPGVPAALGWAATAGGPASWELAMTGRLGRQARELRRVRLLAAGRQLLLLALTQQVEAADVTAATDYRSEILHELIAALVAVDPSKADWTDG